MFAKAAKVETQKARFELEDLRDRAMLSQRETYTKIFDFLTAWRRSAVLSHITVYPKLAAYVGWAYAIKPAHALTQMALQKIPFVPSWMGRGQYTTMGALSEFYAGLPGDLKSAVQTMTEGKSTAKVLMSDRIKYGEDAAHAKSAQKAPEFLNKPQQSHEAIKSVLRDAEMRYNQRLGNDYVYQMSKQNPSIHVAKMDIYKSAMESGFNPEDDTVRKIIDVKAWKVAQKSVLMGDAPFANFIRGAAEKAERNVNPETGKITFKGGLFSFVARSTAPIMSVPEAFFYAKMRSAYGGAAAVTEMAYRGATHAFPDALKWIRANKVGDLSEASNDRLNDWLVKGTAGLAIGGLAMACRAAGHPMF